MSVQTAAEYFAKGKEALEHDHTYLARVCLENAVNEDRKPMHCSYFALALAKSRGDFDTAVKLAQEALAAEPRNTVHHLNLGKILILADRRQEGIAMFRAGLQIDRNPLIINELESLGTRRKPVIPGLPRDNPVNKYLGILFSRLGFNRL